jgi:5'-nucleotidase
MLAASVRPVLVLASALVAGGGLVACSSDSSTPAASTTTKPAASTPLRILVTNDDGYQAPGISTVTEALAELPDVRVTVVAPATNQSGTGGKTTNGTVSALPGPHRTAGGHAATAVVGFPADAVNYALDTMHVTPDVVVSGINQGQNLGAVSAISGTVGAAKRAAEKGIPAIAVSQGLGADPQYDVAARLTIDWIEAHRDALAGHHATVGVVNLNVPTCTTGALRGVRQVPLAPTADGAVAAADCASTVTTITDDVAAFRNGFASVTQLTPAGATVTSSTTFPATKGST